MNLRDMNVAFTAKWIFKCANDREAIWRNVVCAKSRANRMDMMPDLGNKRR